VRKRSPQQVSALCLTPSRTKSAAADGPAHERPARSAPARCRGPGTSRTSSAPARQRSRLLARFRAFREASQSRAMLAP
jgi:hypothetical protein